MEEHLDLLVYPVNDVRPKETVYCKGFVILTLEAINVMRSCRHCSGEGTFRTEVITGQPHGVSGDEAELLGCGNHVDALIQEIAQFVLGELVLSHGNQDLDSHCSLLHVHRYRLCRRGE